MFSGAALRRIRKASGLRQVDLAQKAGVHVATICRAETDKFTPVAETLAALAAALNVDPDAFETPDAPPPPPQLRLSAREISLIVDWRRLPRHYQERVAGVIQGLLGISANDHAT